MYLLADEARRRGLDRSVEFREHETRQVKSALGARQLDLAMDSLLQPLMDGEVRQAFRAGQERVALRHLVFRDAGAAREAWERLEAGDDFLSMANDVFGISVYDSAAGFLGVARYSDLDDALAESAETLAVGQYSEPIRSRYGWHILRVDERLFPALLSESEFQNRRSGIAGREQLRRTRLARDRYVRSVMESLDVRVDPDASARLVESIRGVLGVDSNVPSRPLLLRAEIDDIRSSLSPETVLLTYELEGTEKRYTVGEYLRWLPELSYDEVRHRTMASVGRALRNDVLAELGLSRGLDGDPYVQETIDYTTSAFLFDMMRAYLRADSVLEPSEAELREAYERLGYRTLERLLASFWEIPFETLRQAEVALEEIKEDESAARQYDAFEAYEDLDVRGLDRSDFVRKAPLDQPVVACGEEGECYVLKVTDRQFVYREYEEERDGMRDRLSAILSTAHLNDSLRQAGAVSVDTLLFRRMTDLR
jgi:hypothetical protein